MSRHGDVPRAAGPGGLGPLAGGGVGGKIKYCSQGAVPSLRSHPWPFPASVLRERKSSPKVYREARRLMGQFQEVFEIPPATVGEEKAKPSEEEQVVKALLAEAASKQGSPEQLQLPGRRTAKKVPKV